MNTFPNKSFNYWIKNSRAVYMMKSIEVFFFSFPVQKAKRLQSKKQEGNESFASGKYQEAHDIYTEALTIDPLNKSTNAKLYYNRALVCSKVWEFVFSE